MASKRDTDSLVATVEALCGKSGYPCTPRRALDDQLGMFATRRVAPGERVASEAPLTLTPCESARPFVCAFCFADARDKTPSKHGLPARWSRRCATCRVLRFCSASCEAALSSRHHGYECSVLAMLANEERETQQPVVAAEAADHLAQAIRLLADRHNGNAVQLSDELTVAYADYRRRLVSPSSRADEARVAIEQAHDVAMRAVPPLLASMPPSDLLDVLSRMNANVFAVCGRGARDLGRASFVGVLHLFNHSCAPNIAFDCVPMNAPSADGAAPSFCLVSLREIAAGEELLLSYVSTADEPQERREHLQRYYGFECTCERCAGADEEAHACRLAALRCSLDECCTGYAVADTAEPRARRCLHCGRQQPAPEAPLAARAAEDAV